MKNQIGHKLSLVKKLFISMAGLTVLVIPLVPGIINSQPIRAHSLDSDLNKYETDENASFTHQALDNPGRGKEPFQTVKEEQRQEDFIAAPDRRTGSRYTILNPDREISADIIAEEKIVLAKTETRLKTSVNAGRKSVMPETEDAASFISTGISSIKKGQFEDAVSDFSRAINIDQENAVAYIARGTAYYSLNQSDKAISDYNRAIGLNPNLAVAYQNRGSAYFQQGRLDDALSDYTQAIKLNPDLVAAYQDRGNIYQSQGRFNDAVSDYTRVLEMNPEDSAAYSSRGIAYFSLEQHENAFIDFNRAIESDPENIDAYIYRGYYYQAMDKKGKAVADYSKALELNPDIAVAGRLRDEIAQISVNDPSNSSKAEDDQTIECYWTLPMKSNIKKQECKTKAEWAKIEKTLEFQRDVLHGPNYGYFIDRFQGR